VAWHAPSELARISTSARHVPAPIADGTAARGWGPSKESGTGLEADLPQRDLTVRYEEEEAVAAGSLQLQATTGARDIARTHT
jgi:hypothetical protein